MGPLTVGTDSEMLIWQNFPYSLARREAATASPARSRALPRKSCLPGS